MHRLESAPLSLPRDARALAGAMAWAMCALAFPIDAADADDDFTDFRIPSNRGLLWTADLKARASGDKTSGGGLDNSTGFSNASAATRASWFSDSDPAFTAFAVDVAVAGSRAHFNSEAQSLIPPASLLTVNERADREMDEQWALAVTHRTYPWAAPLGIAVSSNGGGGYSQRWNDQSTDVLIVNPGLTSQSIQHNNRETRLYSYLFAASASAGWGRVRNATGVYDAMVLEQRLRETGALTRSLSREGRRRLAEALYLRDPLDRVRERPGRVLWREIERVLADDGALREGGLDPYSVLRAAEPHLGESGDLTSDGVPNSPVVRLTGAFVGVRVQDVSSHAVRRNETGSSFETIQNGVVIGSGSSAVSTRLEDSYDRVEGGPSGEFHLPIGPPLQLDGDGFVVVGLRKEDNYLYGFGRLSLVWLAADRWTATGSSDLNWFEDDRTDGPTTGDFWVWNAALGVSWYLEDRTAITLSARETQQWSRQDPATHFTRSLSASLGLTYRFSGWFATPGFFPVAAMQPLSPPGQP